MNMLRPCKLTSTWRGVSANLWPSVEKYWPGSTSAKCASMGPYPLLTTQGAKRRDFAIRSQGRARSAIYKDGSSGGAASVIYITSHDAELQVPQICFLQPPTAAGDDDFVDFSHDDIFSSTFSFSIRRRDDDNHASRDTSADSTMTSSLLCDTAYLSVSWLQLLCDLFLPVPVVQSQAVEEHDTLTTRLLRYRSKLSRLDTNILVFQKNHEIALSSVWYSDILFWAKYAYHVLLINT